METHLDNLAKELASKYKSKAALFGKDGVVNTADTKDPPSCARWRAHGPFRLSQTPNTYGY